MKKTLYEKAKALKILRKKLKLNQTDLGKLIGKTRWVVTDYEIGRTKIPQTVFDRLIELAG